MNIGIYVSGILAGLYVVGIWALYYFEAGAFWVGASALFALAFLTVLLVVLYFQATHARQLRRAAWACIGLASLLLLRATAPRLKRVGTDGDAEALGARIAGFLDILFDSDWRIDVCLIIVSLILLFLARRLLLDANQPALPGDSQSEVVSKVGWQQAFAPLTTSRTCTIELIGQVNFEDAKTTTDAQDLLRRVLVHKEPWRDVFRTHRLGRSRARPWFLQARHRFQSVRSDLAERLRQIAAILDRLQNEPPEPD